MGEIKSIILGKKVQYTGLFRFDEVYHLIKQFLRQRGYYTIEHRSQEEVFETGKYVMQEYISSKKFNDYAKGIIRFQVAVRNLKDKTIAIEGQRQKYQHGELDITLFADMETDYRSEWENKGWQFLFRTLSDKFIRHDFTHTIEETTRKDCNDMAETIKDYLNMNRQKLQHTEQPPQKA